MDNLCRYIPFILNTITYFVTLRDLNEILYNSYKYGKLSNLRILRIKVATWLLPRYLGEKIQRFPYDDIDIQIKKLNSNKKVEQINALDHLEQILKIIPVEATNTQDCEKIKKIQRAVFKLLWHTKTSSDVTKKAVDMLCRNNHLRTECSCSN